MSRPTTPWPWNVLIFFYVTQIYLAHLMEFHKIWLEYFANADPWSVILFHFPLWVSTWHRCENSVRRTSFQWCHLASCYVFFKRAHNENMAAVRSVYWLAVCMSVCDKTLHSTSRSTFHVERTTSFNIRSACGQYEVQHTEWRTYNYIRIITGV